VWDWHMLGCHRHRHCSHIEAVAVIIHGHNGMDCNLAHCSPCVNGSSSHLCTPLLHVLFPNLHCNHNSSPWWCLDDARLPMWWTSLLREYSSESLETT
jgi:hypothetical protein